VRSYEIANISSNKPTQESCPNKGTGGKVVRNVIGKLNENQSNYKINNKIKGKRNRFNNNE